MAVRRTLNLSQLQTTSIRNRPYDLAVENLAEMPDPAKPLQDFYRALPRTGRVEELFGAANALVQAALAEKDIVWLIDAKFMDSGLAPLLVHLIQRGLAQGVAMTGGAALRDFEIAFHAKTRENVRAGLEDGMLGMSREVGEGLNTIVNEGVKRGFSIGECIGRGILDRQPRHFKRSILAACAARLSTATVHVAIGEEGFHCHPSADGSALGKGALKDLQGLSTRLEGLNEGGVLVSLHESATLHEVFLRSFALARNLGTQIDRFSVIRFGGDNLDFGCVPGIASTYRVPGPIELMVPLFSGVLFSLVE